MKNSFTHFASYSGLYGDETDSPYGLLTAMLEGCYKNETEESLANYVRESLEHVNGQGLVDSFPCEDKPKEARIEYEYLTSYIVLALFAYLSSKDPETFTGEERTRIAGVDSAAFGRGIPGHGYEAEMFRYEVVRMILEANCGENRRAVEEMLPQAYRQIDTYLLSYAGIANEYHPGCAVITEDAFSGKVMNNRISRLAMLRGGISHAVFVYGTLMKGQRANSYLDDALYFGTFTAGDMANYDLGSFPGMVRREGEKTIGEVWFVRDEALERMDWYEGEGELYKREKISVSNEFGEMEAWAYLYLGETDGCKPVSCKWGTKEEE